MVLSIIIVSFNTKELLRKCLASIKNAEVIVVDNASTDGSFEMVKKEFPKVKLIQNKENLGFAKANNQALQEARGEYIVLLNSDTEVKPGAMENLVEFVRAHPEAGIVGVRLLNLDGSIQPSVYHLPTIWRAIVEYWLGQKGAYEKYAPTTLSVVGVEAVTGAAMLIPKKTIEKIGLLDERYFMYFEDLDYCRRVRENGFKVYYLPTVEFIHVHGASGKKISQQTQKWLIQSSKIYHGLFKYYLFTFIIWSGQKCQRFFR